MFILLLVSQNYIQFVYIIIKKSKIITVINYRKNNCLIN